MQGEPLKLEMMNVIAEHSLEVQRQKELKKIEERRERKERLLLRMVYVLAFVVASTIVFQFGDTAFINPVYALKVVGVYESLKFIATQGVRLIKKLM